MRTRILIGALAAAALSAGLASSAGGGAARDAVGAGAGGGADRDKVVLRKSRFGRVIHDRRSGLAAYLFTRDRRNKPRCYGSCAEVWPPWKAKRRPQVGVGLKRRHVRLVGRRGGAKQVTYKGRPLYFYVHDSPGRILCHDVFEFGGDWLVQKRSGRPA